MWIIRKLANILPDLSPLESQRRGTEVLNGTTGVDRLSYLVEGIRAAMEVYRVRP